MNEVIKTHGWAVGVGTVDFDDGAAVPRVLVNFPGQNGPGLCLSPYSAETLAKHLLMAAQSVRDSEPPQQVTED